MPDPMSAAPTDPGMMQKLAAMFGGGASDKKIVAPGDLPDSSAASEGPVAMPQEGAAPSPGDGVSSNSLMEALKNLMTFLSAKQGSASNEGRYQKALEDAGVPADETGITQ